MGRIGCTIWLVAQRTIVDFFQIHQGRGEKKFSIFFSTPRQKKPTVQ